MILHLAATAAAAVAFTEFIGYWLHVLLHSERIEFLSRNHMIHHLLVYAPNKPMRPSRDYLESTYGRANILGLGVEWLVPVAVILSLLLPTLRLIGFPALEQALFTGVSLGWGWLMFGYMHDAMHRKSFWMEGSPLLSGWFTTARKRHDIHHMDLHPSGRSDKNFGICFFAFDRLFGTLAVEHRRFDRAALAAARRRYAYISA